MRGLARLGALLLPLALAIAGCAAMTPAPGKAPAAPPAAPPPATAPRSPGAAVSDSAPTPEALAVLATIPEPLGGSSGVAVPAPPDAYDTLRTDVPVPAATAPLATSAPLPAELPPAAAAPPAAAVPSGAAATARPDTCWRVQIAAPSDAEQGRAMREAGESQLMVPMAVEHVGGRYKVHSRDCLSRSAAEKLRARANDSGFQGAFLVRDPGTH